MRMNTATAAAVVMMALASTQAHAFEKDAPKNDLSNVELPAARTNLGLGAAATHEMSDFLQPSNNFSDIGDAATARTNLGLGAAATQALSAFLQPSNNFSDVADIATARTNLGLGTGDTPTLTGVTLSGGAATDGVLVPDGSITGGYPSSNDATGNRFSFLNKYTGAGLTGGSATGVLARLWYQPTSGDDGNHAGMYAINWMDAPYSFTGVPAAFGANVYAMAQITATIATGGTDNVVGDVLTTVGGTCTEDLNVQPQFIVDSVAVGGVVTAVHFNKGTGACSVYPTNPVTTTSSNGAATPPTLDLTVDTSPNFDNLLGAKFRVRNQSAGTVTNAISVYADGAWNTANGAITNAYSVYMKDAYSDVANPVTNSYGLYAPGEFNKGMIAAASDIDITIKSYATGSIMLYPGDNGFTYISVSASLPALSGSGNASGLYAYMTSSADAYIDAVAEGASSSQVFLRSYNNGTYTGIGINSTGGLILHSAVAQAGVSGGELGFPTLNASTTAPGASGGKLEMVCGTNAGTLKLIAYGGTSNTPVTVQDNIGGGATGC